MSFIDMFPTHRIEGEERSRLATVYQSLVLPNITTPRKLKRYLNKLNVTVQVLGEEICPTDVFGMVVLALPGKKLLDIYTYLVSRTRGQP